MRSFFEKTYAALLTNRGLKVLSLVMALMTWHMIRQVTSFETIVKDIPVEIQLREGWTVLEQKPAGIDIRFRGSKEDIGYLSYEQVKVTLDLREETFQGSRMFVLDAIDVQCPPGTQPLSLRPNHVTVRIDREVSKQVEVKAPFRDNLDEGLEVVDVRCNPATVTLFGPAMRLRDIAQVRTTPINLEGPIISFSEKVPLVSPNAEWIRMQPAEVEVNIEIVEHAHLHTVEHLPIHATVLQTLPNAIEITPRNINVTFQGKENILKELSAQNVFAYVDCSELKVGFNYELSIRIHAPQGVLVVKKEPPSANVLVSGP